MSKRKQFISENGVIYANHERVVIDGRTFEVAGCISPDDFNEIMVKCTSLRDLRECYARPSQAKQNIYERWCIFASNNRIPKFFGTFGICSFNICSFTFDCLLSDGFDNFYAHITSTHNYIYVFGKEV